METVGDAFGNALMEAVIGRYRTECIRTTVFHAGPYRTIADAEDATSGWATGTTNDTSTDTRGVLSP